MLYGWKENSMLTNCLAACIHLTISVSEIERDICEKIVILSYPGFSSVYWHPLWYGKTRMVSLPDGEKFRRYVYSFWRDLRTWRTDGQTDTAWRQSPRLCIASRGKNCAILIKLVHYSRYWTRLQSRNQKFWNSRWWRPPSWKSLFLAIIHRPIVRFQRNFVPGSRTVCRRGLHDKNCKFLKSKMADGRHFENR